MSDDLLERLEASQKACFDTGQHIAAMDIQSARAEIARLRGVAQREPQPERMRSSGPAEQSGSGTWTAGIDIIRSYPFQDTQWHLHAIEFHHKVRQEAEALRDLWLSAMTEGEPATGSEDPVKTICDVLCKSRVFETGQGTCALTCMDQLGAPRKRGCHHAQRVHDKIAHSILEALAKRAGIKPPSPRSLSSTDRGSVA